MTVGTPKTPEGGGLGSTSTDEEISAAYDDNSDYDIEGDVSKCKTFIQACRILIRRMSSEIRKGNIWLKEEIGRIQDELKTAIAWLKNNDSTFAASSGKSGHVIYHSLENFRQ